MIRLKSEKDLEGLRASGKILAFVLGRLKGEARAGLRLDFLDGLARELLEEAGARPAFFGYKPEGAKKPYPAAICTSVNATIVHGLPGSYELKEGDILKIELTVTAYLRPRKKQYFQVPVTLRGLRAKGPNASRPHHGASMDFYTKSLKHSSKVNVNNYFYVHDF